MGSPLTKVEEYIANVVHHTRIAVEAAIARAEADAAQEKTKIAADLRDGLAKVEAAVKADAPEIEAAIKKGVQDAIAAAEAALVAHGL